MRIAQVVLPEASAFDRKSQSLDLESLTTHYDVIVCDIDAAPASSADVVHVYGTPLPARALRRLPMPYVASTDLVYRRFTLRRTRPPQYVLTPIAPADPDGRIQLLPEAVDDPYFSGGVAIVPDRPPGVRIAGTFGRSRPGVANAVEQTLSRIERFRSDLVWRLFDQAPSPSDLAGVDVWVDPATTENDFDGFVAEAIAAGKAVVASRTPINAQRLEEGRTGFLVPPRDPNELVHAILAALFKPEVARLKIEAARQTAGKFRARQRLRVLDRIYEALKVR